jgi:uncharacterized protein YcbX
MGKLTPEQAKQLKDLQAQADAPDEDDFDVEIWEGDKGARVPYSKGRSWLSQTFGIDLGDPPAADDGADKPAGKDAPPADDGVRRFGRRVS